MSEQTLRLEWWDADELDPNPKNWRRHPDSQTASLKQAIEKVGWAGALLYNERTERLVDGHARKEMFSGQRVPVLVGDWSEEDEALILATLDPIASLASQDHQALVELVGELGELDGELGAMVEQMEKRARAMIPSEEDPSSEVESEEVAVEFGQVYQIGRHRIMCGDSTNGEHVQELLGGEGPGMMVTDPPYGVSYDPDWRNEAVAFLKGDGTRKVGKVENDDRADWTGAFLLFPGSVAYVWHAALHAETVAESIKVAGFEIRTQVVWAKVRPAISRGHYNWQHEPCWYAVRKGAVANWCGDKSQSTLWKIDKPQMDADADRSSLHGTQKPVECMARPIRNHAFESVYDPFVGTGTTIVAAERTGRASFSMELKPSYCEGAIQRIEALTGEERRLVE